MKKIGIYPGNFQPASMAHYDVYKKLRAVVGSEDVFVVTTDRDPIPEAPLNFGDKEQIWVRYGVSINNIIKVNSLPSDNPNKVDNWRPEEVYQRFSPQHTAAIIAVNEKEYSQFLKRKSKSQNNKGMSAGLSTKTKKELKEIFEELGGNTEDSERLENKEVWLTSEGKPQYYQPYRGNEHDLKSFEEHAYVIVMDDTRIDGKPVSTTNIRTVLGSKKYDENQKKKFFRFVFGWFDQGLFQLMVEKFRYAHQVAVNIEDEPMAQISPKVIIPKKLEEVVIEVLKGLEEDYDVNINDPSSSDDSDSGSDMASSLDQEKSQAQKSADAAKKKIDLVHKKAAAERDIKGLEKDLTWKQSDIIRKRKDELPGKRKELDAINKQISNSSTSV